MVEEHENKSNNEKKCDCDIRKFEYEQLREESARNTTISYTVMTIFTSASLLIFVEVLKEGGMGPEASLLAMVLSLLLLLMGFTIDRRLTAFTNVRRVRMAEIERDDLKFKNILLTTTLEEGEEGFNTTNDDFRRVYANTDFFKRKAVKLGRLWELILCFLFSFAFLWILLLVIRHQSPKWLWVWALLSLGIYALLWKAKSYINDGHIEDNSMKPSTTGGTEHEGPIQFYAILFAVIAGATLSYMLTAFTSEWNVLGDALPGDMICGWENVESLGGGINCGFMSLVAGGIIAVLGIILFVGEISQFEEIKKLNTFLVIMYASVPYGTYHFIKLLLPSLLNEELLLRDIVIVLVFFLVYLPPLYSLLSRLSRWLSRLLKS